jgi:hypothetical protein
MKIKKNTFSTLVLELFFPSIANCRKLKIQKNPKIDFPYSGGLRSISILKGRLKFLHLIFWTAQILVYKCELNGQCMALFL